MHRVGAHLGERHLVRAKGPFDRLSIDLLRAGPALRRAQHDHRPARALLEALRARLALNALDLRDDAVQSAGHQLMHRGRLLAFDHIRGVAVTAQQLLELRARDAGQQGRVGDLVPVQVQDRQHGAVGSGIEKLVALPARGKRPGLRLTIADDARGNEAGIVEHRAIRMTQGVAELASFVNRPRSLRRHMTRNSAGEGELPEQALEALGVLGDVWVELAVGPLEIGVAHDRRPAVSGSGKVDHVEIELPDDPVQVHIDEILSRRSAPVAEQPGLDVLRLQRLAQERVGIQVNLPDRDVVRRPPVGIHSAQQLGSQRSVHQCPPMSRSGQERARIR